MTRVGGMQAPPGQEGGCCGGQMGLPATLGRNRATREGETAAGRGCFGSLWLSMARKKFGDQGEAAHGAAVTVERRWSPARAARELEKTGETGTEEEQEGNAFLFCVLGSGRSCERRERERAHRE